MQIRFLTSLTTTINPFSRLSKVPRLFLAQLPPKARSQLKMDVTQLPRGSVDPSTLKLTFKDGKEMSFVFQELDEKAKELGVEKIKLQDVLEEVDRHCRILGRKEALAG